jgi:hypothetical protein
MTTKFMSILISLESSVNQNNSYKLMPILVTAERVSHELLSIWPPSCCDGSKTILENAMHVATKPSFGVGFRV